MKGFVKIEIIKDGSVTGVIEGPNIITRYTQELLSKLLVGAPGTVILSKVGFGTGSSTPTPDDTGLTDAYIKPITNYSFPEPGVICINYTLEENEMNGITIREIGLFTSDNKLIARKVLAGIEKQDILKLNSTWQLQLFTSEV